MSRSIYIQNTTTLAGSDDAVQNPEGVADGKVVLLGVDGEGQVGLGASGLAPPTGFKLFEERPMPVRTPSAVALSIVKTLPKPSFRRTEPLKRR